MNLITVYPDRPRGRLMRFVAWPFVFGRVLTRHWNLGASYAAHWANASLRVPSVLAVLLLLAACSAQPGQVTAAAITGYDAAVAAEIVYLESGKATPAQALCMRQVRLKADKGVKDVAAADKAGGATAALMTSAQTAVNDLAAQAANPGKGC